MIRRERGEGEEEIKKEREKIKKEMGTEKRRRWR